MWPRLCMLIFAAALAESNACGQTPVASIEIDLQEQTAYLIQNGRAILATPISSAREGHLTKTGSFKVLERARSHFSTLHGKIVDARGNTIVADADADMPVPRGCRFVPAPMRYFIRFNNATGMHAGYPASHGCVRLPEQDALAIFNAVDIGTPVTVFGHAAEEARRGPAGLTTRGDHSGGVMLR